jgi:hypothetical protein
MIADMTGRKVEMPKICNTDRFEEAPSAFKIVDSTECGRMINSRKLRIDCDLHSIITRLIFVFVICFYGCVDSHAAKPSTASSGTNDRTAGIARMIKPGMTCDQAEQFLKQQRPGDDWNDSWLSWAGGEVALGRYPLDAESNLLIEYDTKDKKDFNVKPDDTIVSVRIVHFDDLRPQLPAGLFSYVKLINRSPSVGDTGFDPVALIRAVNGLRQLEKAQALRALREYVRLVNDDGHRSFSYDLDEQRVFLIARLLFVRRDGDARMPWMYIGGTSPQVQPDDPAWPLFPLVVQDDIPFHMASGYDLAGHAQSPLEHLEYCEKNCVIRPEPLRPSQSPLVAAEHVFASDRWHNLFGSSDAAAGAQFRLRWQALKAVKNLMSKSPEEEQLHPNCVPLYKADETWAAYLRDDRLRLANWNPVSEIFTH